MDIFKIICSFIPPLAIGYLISTSLLSLAKINGLFKIFFAMALSPGIGFAVSSILYFIWINVFQPNYAMIWFVVFEVSIIIILGILWVFLFLRPESRSSHSPSTRPIGRKISLSFVIPILILLVYLLNFLDDWQFLTYRQPHGDWDAWSIWNLRARFIYSGNEWKNGFSGEILWSHPDYPLLLPVLIARIWGIIGNRSVIIPSIIGLIYSLSIVSILVIVLYQFQDLMQSLLAGMFGISIVYLGLGFKQYADLPLTFYILGANIVLFLCDILNPKRQSLFTLAGFLVGATFYTKNEGWAFFIGMIISRLVLYLLESRDILSILKENLFFLVGLFPVLLTALYFKVELAPSNDLIGNMNFVVIREKILDFDRYILILNALKDQFLSYGSLLVALFPLLIFYVLIMGVSFPIAFQKGLISLIVRICGLLLVYFMVYILTYQDLSWHLKTSIQRLVTHLAPSILFLCFVVIPSRKKFRL